MNERPLLCRWPGFWALSPRPRGPCILFGEVTGHGGGAHVCAECHPCSWGAGCPAEGSDPGFPPVRRLGWKRSSGSRETQTHYRPGFHAAARVRCGGIRPRSGRGTLTVVTKLSCPTHRHPPKLAHALPRRGDCPGTQRAEKATDTRNKPVSAAEMGTKRPKPHASYLRDGRLCLHWTFTALNNVNPFPPLVAVTDQGAQTMPRE